MDLVLPNFLWKNHHRVHLVLPSFLLPFHSQWDEGEALFFYFVFVSDELRMDLDDPFPFFFTEFYRVSPVRFLLVPAIGIRGCVIINKKKQF